MGASNIYYSIWAFTSRNVRPWYSDMHEQNSKWPSSPTNSIGFSSCMRWDETNQRTNPQNAHREYEVWSGREETQKPNGKDKGNKHIQNLFNLAVITQQQRSTELLFYIYANNTCFNQNKSVVIIYKAPVAKLPEIYK